MIWHCMVVHFEVHMYMYIVYLVYACTKYTIYTYMYIHAHVRTLGCLCVCLCSPDRFLCKISASTGSLVVEGLERSMAVVKMTQGKC